MATDLSSLTASLALTTTWQVGQNINGLTIGVGAGPATYGPTPNPTWAFGNGAGQVTNVYYGYGALAGGSVFDIDLYNLTAVQSDVNYSFAFRLIKFIMIELLPNPDNSQGSSGIQLGGLTGSNGWDGWWGANATPTIDGNVLNVIPYIAGSDTGKIVNATTRLLQLTNLDPANYATVRVTVYGIQSTD